MSELHRIELGNATFGLTVVDDVVRDTAPIIKWANGLSWKKKVKPWLIKKGAVIDRGMNEPPPNKDKGQTNLF